MLERLIGESPAMEAARRALERLFARAAGGRLPATLIVGETGTGKGLLARELHAASPRAKAPLVSVNCAAIPPTLMEAELFGFEQGAFTDAHAGKPGLFQCASGGTLLLDELAFLQPSAQAKLLTAVEDGAVRRLGARHAEPVDVWLISATSADMKEALRRGEFLQALYHRLGILRIDLPPLRERGDDILLLAEHFLGETCAAYRLGAKAFEPEARAALSSYGWPGNVRELKNTVERAALLHPAARLPPSALGLPGARTSSSPPRRRAAPIEDALSDLARDRIAAALAEAGGNVSRAAERLQVPRNTLRYRMRRLGLDRGSPEASPAAAAAASASRRLVALLVETTEEAAEGALGALRAQGALAAEVAPGRCLAWFSLERHEDPPRQGALAALGARDERRRAALDAFEAATLPGGELHRDEPARLLAALQARLQRPGTIVVGPGLAADLGHDFQLAPSSGEALVLLGARPRGAPPLVGREAEVALSLARWASAAAGRGQIVGLIGEPGSGKTRLLSEIAARLPAAARVVWARCEPHAAASPLATASELLRELGGGEAAEQAPGGALVEAALAAARAQPLALLIEDLHWIDAASEAAVQRLCEALGSASVLLLHSQRPPYRPPWLGLSHATQLPVLPLSIEESEALVRSLSGPGAPAALAEAGGGNPLFLELLARSPGEAPAPASLRRLLDLRVERLDAAPRRVLGAASVLGPNFSAALLSRLCPGDDVETQLQHLRRLDLVDEHGGHERRWSFHHALVRDAAERSLTSAERAALHGRAGRALEEGTAEQRDERVERLAYHFERSNDPEAALTYVLAANQRALRARAPEAALAHVDRAMALFDALPDSPERQRQRLVFLGQQFFAYLLLLRVAELRSLLVPHEPAAERLDDPALLGEFSLYLGYCQFVLGSPEAALRSLRRAVALCLTVGNQAAAAWALVSSAWAHNLRGEFPSALPLAERARSLLEAGGDPLWLATAHGAACWALGALGRLGEAADRARSIAAVRDPAGVPIFLALSAWNLSRVHTLEGDLHKAREQAEVAAGRALNPLDAAIGRCHLGWALCRLGEPRRGVDILAEALARGRSVGFAIFEEFVPYLGEGLLSLGELDRADELLREALDAAERRGLRFAAARAHRWLARVALRRDNPDQARLHRDACLAALQAFGAQGELRDLSLDPG